MRTLGRKAGCRSWQRFAIVAGAVLCGLAVFSVSVNKATAQSIAAVIPGTTTTGHSCATYDEMGYMYYLPCPVGNGPSIDRIVDERIGQMVEKAQLTRLLLGSYEQINCSNTCISAFGAVGSFSAGFHGRKYLTQRLSLIGGLSINKTGSGSVSSRQSITGALGVRYDFVDWGSSRPFFEIGGSLSPSERSRSVRRYSVGGTTFAAATTAKAQTYMSYIRAGWVKRLTPRDEFSVFADLVRQWHRTSAVREAASANNPFPAAYQSGTDMMNVARFTVQHVHLMGSSIEFHANATIAHSFGVKSGVKVNVAPLGAFQAAPTGKTWFEYGARIGFRVSKRVTIDTFLVGASGPQPIGNSLHGGIGVRAVF